MEVVELLLQARSEIDAANHLRLTALHLACRHGHEARMPSSTLIPFFGGFRFPYKPLLSKTRAPFLFLGYWATEEGVVQVLLEARAATDRADDHGSTPLQCACHAQFSNIVPLS